MCATMRANRLLFSVTALVFALTLLTSGCSSSKEDDEALEASEESSSQGNLGNDDAGEGNGQENIVDGGRQAQNGAEVNNDTASGDEIGGDHALGENAPAGNPLSGNPALDGGTNPAAGGNIASGNAAGNPLAAPPLNNVPVNAATNAAANAASAPAPAPAAPTGASPVAGGRVRYVKEGGVQVVNQPNGNAVATLEQGDHPVTWEENGWLRLSGGMYVPVDSMSDRGIPRTTAKRAWNH